MKAKISLIVILLIILFSSCDPHNEYRMLVKNETNYSININPQGIIVNPNSQAIVYEYFGMGGPGSNGYCEIGPGNIGNIEAEVQTHPELVVRKKLSSMDNWVYTKQGNSRKGYRVQCMAVINNSDIIPK